MASKPTIVGLIPARAGSKRIKDKNVRLLQGHPVLGYTISSAQSSGVFDALMVSTDSDEYAAIAKHYGAVAVFAGCALLSALWLAAASAMRAPAEVNGLSRVTL